MLKIFILIFSLFVFSSNTNASYYDNLINKYVNYKEYQNIKAEYPSKKGTILVTPDKMKNVLPLGHAAIVVDEFFVYEAGAQGVQRGYNNWQYTKEKTFGLEVTNLNADNLNSVLDYIIQQENKKYNVNFFNTSTRDSFYCSHLIFSAFYDVLNINLDTNLFGNAKNKGAIHPMELVLSKQTDVIYYHENN